MVKAPEVCPYWMISLSKRGMKLQDLLLLVVRCGGTGKRDKVPKSSLRGLDFIPPPEYNRERSTSL
jgi:hypothetical protein